MVPTKVRGAFQGMVLVLAALLSVSAAGAQSASGTFHGSMECGRLPFGTDTLTIQATLTVSGSAVRFSRVVTHHRNGVPIGTESGQGRIDASGRVTLTSSWRARRDSLTGTYSGLLTATGGTLRGRQTVLFERQSYPRSCLITFRR